MEGSSTESFSPSAAVDWRVAAIVSAAVGLTAVAAVRSVIRKRALQRELAKSGNNQSTSQSSGQQRAQNGLNRSSANGSADNSSGNNQAAANSATQNGTSKRRFVHRGITCKLCEAEPIVGERYKCATCPMFDVCEMCEPTLDNTHDRTHLFLKIRIPIPPRAIPSHQLLPVFYPGS
jgi:hypothetical protein